LGIGHTSPRLRTAIAQLESFIKSDIDARELKRAIAVRMALSGKLYQEISKMLGVSEFFVGYRKKTFGSSLASMLN
jgi:putative transposase